MNFTLKTALSLAILLLYTSTLFGQSQQQVSDQIVAVVNDRIILKSDVDEEVRNFIRQSELDDRDISFSEDLWYGALQSMVDNYVLLEKARMDSIIVSDDIVNRQMDQRINQLIRQAGSEEALEESFGQSLVELRAEFREQFREQLTVQQVQQQRASRINITRPEVQSFYDSIPEDQLPIIPEQVGVSQIVIIPPPLDDAKNEAYEKASAIRDSIVNHDANFEEMAQKYSEDQLTARRGGLLPMMPMGDLVANYSAAASALEPGQISEVVETQFGLHIIRLNERSADNIETNHILIRIDEAGVDEQAAIDKLNALKDSVLTHGESFADLARRHSEDEDSRAFGGRILNPQSGERLLQISQLEPALYRIVLLLDEEGEISEPRAYNPSDQRVNRAFRIVRLDRHIPEHRANMRDDYDRLRDFALQEKQNRILNEWIEGLRDDVYVDFKIEMPDESLMEERELINE